MDEYVRDLLDAQQGRKPAQERLDQKKKNNAREYLIMMARILADENKTPLARELAGLNWKNLYISEDESRREQRAKQWLSLAADLRNNLKACGIKGLQSPEAGVSRAAAQVVAQIALIELPVNEWPELIKNLLGMTKSKQRTPGLMVSVFVCLAYICEESPSIDPPYMQDILNALTTGMKKEVGNPHVILAATKGLEKALRHIEPNMEKDAERNYIMKSICSVCTFPDARIREAGLNILIKMIEIYYHYLAAYMKVISGIVANIMNKDEQNVSMLAVEFWSSLCDREYQLYEEAERDPSTPFFRFIEGSVSSLVPTLLRLIVRQKLLPEDEGDTWDLPAAAATCLGLIAGTICDKIIPEVMPFVKSGIRDAEPTRREAALMVFGSILEGPSTEVLEQDLNGVLPILVNLLEKETVIEVKDTATWTMSRICEFHPLVIHPLPKLRKTLQVLCTLLSDSVGVANFACAAIHFLAVSCADKKDSKMDAFFTPLVSALLKVIEREDMDQSDLQNAAFDAIAALIESVSVKSFDLIRRLCKNFLDRLNRTFSMPDTTEAELDNRLLQQGYLCSTLLTMVHKLDDQIAPFADQMIFLYLKIFESAKGSPYVHEDAIMAVGSVANAIPKSFLKYVGKVMPYLIKGLGAVQQHPVCTASAGAVGDIFRAVGEEIIQYCPCDTIMSALVKAATNPQLDRSTKPHILSCMGDIAFVIGPRFKKYLDTVVKLLLAASKTKKRNDEFYNEYIDQLREGIMNGFTGILQGFKDEPEVCIPFIGHLFNFLQDLWADRSKPRSLELIVVGLLGDAAGLMLPEVRRFFTAQILHILAQARRSDDEETRDMGIWATDQFEILKTAQHPAR